MEPGGLGRKAKPPGSARPFYGAARLLRALMRQRRGARRPAGRIAVAAPLGRRLALDAKLVGDLLHGGDVLDEVLGEALHFARRDGTAEGDLPVLDLNLDVARVEVAEGQTLVD